MELRFLASATEQLNGRRKTEEIQFGLRSGSEKVKP